MNNNEDKNYLEDKNYKIAKKLSLLPLKALGIGIAIIIAGLLFDAVFGNTLDFIGVIAVLVLILLILGQLPFLIIGIISIVYSLKAMKSCNHGKEFIIFGILDIIAVIVLAIIIMAFIIIPGMSI